MDSNTEYWKNVTTNLHWGSVKVLSDAMLELMGDTFAKDSSIVELGSGQGRNLSTLLREGYTDVLGVEINFKNIFQMYYEYKDDALAVKKADVIDYLKGCKKVDLMITCSFAYLIQDKSIMQKIMEKCRYYLFIEPSLKTHLKENNPLYLPRLDCMKEVEGLEIVRKIDKIDHDQYLGALVKCQE